MHSKWQIWDFFSTFQKNYLNDFNGILCISAFDALALKMMKDYMLKGPFERTVHHKSASEVSADWILEEFQTLSLFGGNDCYVIHQPHDLKNPILELLFKLDLNERFILFCFESETSSAFKKIVKESSWQLLQIEAPRFYEGQKLLSFVCSYLRLPLSQDGRNWILENIENDLSDFYTACTMLKLNYPQKSEVNSRDIQEVISSERLDQFALASLFCRKRKNDFFEKIIFREKDFERFRNLFGFMQSHLIKLCDPAPLQKKNRLSNYDKEILQASQLWKADEILKEIALFNHWEILAKRKDPFLWIDLRLKWLENQHVGVPAFCQKN